MPADHRRRILAGLDRIIAAPPQRSLPALPGRGLPPGDPPLAQPRLMLLLSGRHRVEIAGDGEVRTVDLDRGTGLALAAGAWLRRRHAAPFRLLGVVFHRGFLRLLINRHDGGTTGRPAAIWHHTARPPPPALWRQFAILADPGTPEAMRQPGLLALLHGCRALLADDPGEEDAGRGAALHQAMLAQCLEHLAAPLGRARLARLHGIHPNHVSRLFRRHGGEGFARCLIRLRMERALTLLAQQPPAPMAAIAAACGYTSLPYFVNEFRRHHGCTPGEARGHDRRAAPAGRREASRT